MRRARANLGAYVSEVIGFFLGSSRRSWEARQRIGYALGDDSCAVSTAIDMVRGAYAAFEVG